MRRFSLLCAIICLFGVSVPALATDIVIEGNDAMQFNLKEFKVKAGEKVKLTLKHVGQLPEAAMGHNVVILQKGIDAMPWGLQVPAKGGNAENGYIPTDPAAKKQIIVHTEMLGGGEETTIEFTAPTEKGAYPFLCTFPGHVGLMRGNMIVE
jgi:azurin